MTKCSQRISPIVMCSSKLKTPYLGTLIIEKMSNFIEMLPAKIYINIKTDNIVIYEGFFREEHARI